MSSVEKGRFCQSCQKTVYDFTRASDRQIAQHLQEHPKSCGRFLVTQLDRDLLVPTQKSNWWTAGISGVLSLFVLGSAETSAQTKQQSVHGFRAKYNREPRAGQPVHQKGEMVSVKTSVPLTIQGTVVEGGLPLPSANVRIKGATKGVETDFDGRFSIVAKAGDTLQVSFLGYVDYEKRLTPLEDNLIVVLQPDYTQMGGEVVIMGGLSRPSFFARLRNRITGWFR